MELQEYLSREGKTFRTIKVEGTVRLSDLKLEKEIKINLAVICIGGDGTLSEVIGYLVNNQLKLPVFVIPCGKANFISSALDIPSKVDYQRLAKGNLKKIDLGLCLAQEKRQYFLLGVGLGFEQKFLDLAANYQKKLKSKLSYYLAGLIGLFRLRPIAYSLKINGENLNFKSVMVVILNLKPMISPFFPIFSEPKIRPDDGWLDLIYVEHRNLLFSFLGVLSFHLLGRIDFGLVKRIKTKEIELKTKDFSPVQIDGEPKGKLPVKISLLPGAVQFLV